MRQKLIIWGTSGHSKVITDIIHINGEFEIAGYIDDIHIDRHGTDFLGSPILGGREQLDLLLDFGIDKIIFGFGDCKARLYLANLINDKGFSLVTAIHPSAVIAKDVSIDEGCVIAAGAVINPGSKIGKNVIINTCASVDHDCTIEDGVHICPGVHLAGHVFVGRGVWVGIGSTIIDRVHIGPEAYIGAGSVVIDDVLDGSVVFGVPAKLK